MTVHIARDYNPPNSGYFTGGPLGSINRLFTSFMYNMVLFAHRVLGYSVVGSWGFTIDSPARSLSVSAATNTGPITITTGVAHQLSNGDWVSISGGTGNAGVNGQWMVQVVNTTQAILLGSLGTGAYNTGTATLITGFFYATGSPGGSTGASINITGASSVYAVGIPSSVRTVVAGDVGRPLVLKSTLYPTKNSGIFKISSIDAVNNRYIIDYRSTDTPPPETGTLTWWLYEIETTASNFIGTTGTVSYTVNAATNASPIVITTATQAPFINSGQVVNVTGVGGNTNANGTWTVSQVPGTLNQFQLLGSSGNGTFSSNGTITIAGYANYGPYFGSKIILQSPHASGWQMRVCCESSYSGTNNISVSVGFNGSATGDFLVGGVTNHVATFLNTMPGGATASTMVGGGNQSSASRHTFVGDDGGQAFFTYSRSLATQNNGMLLVGIPDNEPIPNYPNTDRAVTWGSVFINDYGTIQMKQGTLTNAGYTFRTATPEMCQLVGWATLDGQQGTNPFYNGNAGDSPFLSATEVIPIEVWGGCTTDPALNLPEPTSGATVYTINQRFMGTAPFLRNGRTNFGNFALTTDNTTTLSVLTTSGNGVSPIQVQTTASNVLATGQTVVISGVGGNTAANGTFVINVINNTTFTLNGTTGNGTYTTGGTINGTPHWLHLQNGIFLLWNGCAGLNA